MPDRNFNGPIFIVGMPRSGKKLLRDLLNQNPNIGIPIHETTFIPRMAELFGIHPEFNDELKLQDFYNEFTKDTFYKIFKNEGRVLEKKELGQLENKQSWHSILECIFRFYAPEGRDENFIWGDKSPHYMSYMPLIKSMIPTAKFLHCIRDPRDCCVSYKKAWGKSIYRAAESWRQGMKVAIEDSQQLGVDYKRVYYESLLKDPAKTIGEICSYLDIEYLSSMTELSRAPEILGDTAGETRIVRENLSIYRTHLSQSQTKRIEEIVSPVATALGYELENEVQYKPLEPRLLKLFTIYDALTSIRFHIHQYGLLQGLSQLFHWHTRGSWMANHIKNLFNPAHISRKNEAR